MSKVYERGPQMFIPTIAVAPMMDYTHRHFRYLLRLITRHIFLYTEMVNTAALLSSNQAERWLKFHPSEHPVALQLGGSDPKALAQCARLGQAYGYNEINLNLGCPSPRVQKGRFGACLMKEVPLVADCIQAMREAVTIPVTVKTRLGVDEFDSYEYLQAFIQCVAERGGCRHFILHARKAWLTGLNPKANRTVPPLQYERVYQLKRDFPALKIILNGGIQTLAQVQAAISQGVDGVMLGREACRNPYLLSEVDRLFYHDNRPSLSRREVVEQFLLYMQAELQQGESLACLKRALLGIFHGQPGASAWRRLLTLGGGVTKLPSVVYCPPKI